VDGFGVGAVSTGEDLLGRFEPAPTVFDAVVEEVFEGEGGGKTGGTSTKKDFRTGDFVGVGGDRLLLVVLVLVVGSVAVFATLGLEGNFEF